MNRPDVRSFHHRETGTWTHVVADPATGAAAIVDPVLDFDVATGAASTTSADALVRDVRARGWRVDWLLETHAHADHLSAATRLRALLGGAIGIGAGIDGVRSRFADPATPCPAATALFDRRFDDGATFPIGSVPASVIPCPGHTEDSVAYLVGDALFVGDSLFMPDAGTARCDFPGGDAATLYRSIRRLFELPRATRVFVCHDYASGGRAFACETTIGAQRDANIHVRDGIDEAAFVRLREARDATLAPPALIGPALRANLFGR